MLKAFFSFCIVFSLPELRVLSVITLILEIRSTWKLATLLGCWPPLGKLQVFALANLDFPSFLWHENWIYPPRIPVANEGFLRDLLRKKCNVILVTGILGWGLDP